LKNVFSLKLGSNSKYNLIAEFDKTEIDNPNAYSLSKINYRNRINKVISIIEKRFKPSQNIKIADFGCAQGNISLMLAEMGYKVFAIDIREDFLEYSKLKYEKGDIEWIVLNIEDCEFDEKFFDVIVMGELVEHCAFPERIIDKVFKFLKKNGLLILTTPNGQHIRNKSLATFSSLSKKDKESLQKRQFGPNGVDHLFLFTVGDLKLLLPANSKIVNKGYIGTAVLNKFTIVFFKLLPIPLVYAVIRFFEKIPFINMFLSSGIYCVIKKV